MNGDGLFAFSEWRLAEQIGLLLLALAGLGLLRRIALRLATRPAPWGRLHRLLPPVEALALLLLLAAAIRNLLAGSPEAQLAAGALLLTGLLWAGRDGLRDLVSGWLLRLEEPWSPGRRVRVDGSEGTISRLGLRSMTLAVDDGRRIWLPWGRLAERGVELLGGGAGGEQAASRMRLPRGAEPDGYARRRLERRLLLDRRVLPGSPVWITGEGADLELRARLLDPALAVDLERDLAGEAERP